jgi:putative ABC transport system permease protein
MVWYNLKLTIRRVIKDKVFSGINIFGLVIGITSFFILFIYVSNEKNFDKHFSDYEKIYRVISKPSSANTARARGLLIIKEAAATFPEVEDATQFSHCPVGDIKIDNKTFQQEDIMSVDESFISMFSVESLVGDLSDITKPNTAFITEEFAKKHFKDENPVGKTIDIRALQYISYLGEYEIKGIVKNTPPKTHFNYQILLSQKGSLHKYHDPSQSDRKISWAYSYVKLKKVTSYSLVEDKFLAYYNQSDFKNKRGPKEFDFSLCSLTDIHLNSNHGHEFKENNSKINVGLFMGVSFVILIISLLNFINLSLAKLIKRSKELGLKKAIGANHSQLISQILFEVLLFCLVSIIISFLLIETIQPFINSIFDIKFSIYYSDPVVYMGIITVIVSCVGIAAIFIWMLLFVKLSAGNIMSEKNNFSGSFVLKALLVSQITIVIILLSATLLVNKQINFISEKPVGYDKENVVVLHIKDRRYKDPTILADELRKMSQVKSVGFTRQYFGYPPENLPLDGLGLDGSVDIVVANYDYLQTMNIKFLENWINPSANEIEGFVINNFLYKRLLAEHGSMDAVEKYMTNQETTDPADPIINKIIGVAEDFNYYSAHHQVNEFAFDLNESRFNAKYTHVRLNTGSIRKAMNEIEKIWDELYPNHALSYFFMDEKIAQQYKAETILGRVLSTFSVIGVLICIIGISALALFISQQRTNEIGIRKVNGARISEILAMLNRDFIKWVLVAFIVACPVAWFAMNKWLENFAYKTELSWWIFALAGVLALGIALLTVSWQSWKAASRNPVEALRYE